MTASAPLPAGSFSGRSHIYLPKVWTAPCQWYGWWVLAGSQAIFQFALYTFRKFYTLLEGYVFHGFDHPLKITIFQ